MTKFAKGDVPYLVCWVCGENFKDINDSHYACKSSAECQKETLEDVWIYSK